MNLQRFFSVRRVIECSYFHVFSIAFLINKKKLSQLWGWPYQELFGLTWQLGLILIMLMKGKDIHRLEIRVH